MAATHATLDESLQKEGLLDKTTRSLLKNQKSVILQNPNSFRIKREDLKELTLKDLKERAMGVGLEGWEGQSRKTEAFRVRIAVAELLLESRTQHQGLQDIPPTETDWEEFSVEQLKEVCKENGIFCPAKPIRAYLVAILKDFFGERRQEGLRIKFWSKTPNLIGLREESLRLGVGFNSNRRTDRWAFDYIGASLISKKN